MNGLVLVDSSVWIGFFRGDIQTRSLLPLPDANRACVNALILAELLPAMQLRREKALMALLRALPTIDLQIDWEDIVQLQSANLKAGINKVGIPDLLIAQNAVQQGLALLSLDRHFALMSQTSCRNLLLA